MIARWYQQARVRRIIFVAGNLAAAAAFVCLVVWPILDLLAERDAAIVEQRGALARLQGVIAEEARIATIARETDAQVQDFLSGTNEGVIIADLQTRLKSIAEGSGARLRSVQALPPVSREQTRYVGSRLEISGPIGAIHRAVHAVESARPWLFVSAGSIKPSPAASHAGAATEPVIDAQLDIFGALPTEGRER
ncbi:MAG: type II secretion system protein GspM [Xanthobacteraceae bacterium]